MTAPALGQIFHNALTTDLEPTHSAPLGPTWARALGSLAGGGFGASMLLSLSVLLAAAPGVEFALPIAMVSCVLLAVSWLAMPGNRPDVVVPGLGSLLAAAAIGWQLGHPHDVLILFLGLAAFAIGHLCVHRLALVRALAAVSSGATVLFVAACAYGWQLSDVAEVALTVACFGGLAALGFAIAITLPFARRE